MHPSERPTERIPHVPPVAPAPNVAAIIALTCALLGLLVLPILLGPAAVVAGIVGHEQARRTGRGMRVAMGGIVLGLLVLLIAIGV